MELFLITLVAAAVAARGIRWALGKAGVMKTLSEAPELKQKGRRIAWEAGQLRTDLDRLDVAARPVQAATFMPSVGDFLLAAETEPATLEDKRCRKAVQALRNALVNSFGFDEAAFALMREKAQARADKKARKSEKRLAAKSPRSTSTR